MNSQSSRSIPELFSDAVGQLAKLVGNEFELARAELSEKATQAGRAAAMIGAGAVVLIPALVLLLFALSSALIRGGFSEPVAYLLTGAGAALSEKATQAGRAAAMIGAGAVVLIPALVLLLFALSAALIRGGFSEPVAYLLTGAGAALVSVALIVTGLSRLSGDALKPSVMLDQVQRDKVAAKEMVR